MANEAASLLVALHERFLLDHPREAALELERMGAAEAAAELAPLSPLATTRAWEEMAPDVAAELLDELPREMALHLLREADPLFCMTVLLQVDATARQQWLDALPAQVARELRQLFAYPEGSAGRLMNTRVSALRADQTVAGAIDRLRSMRQRGLRELFLVDGSGQLVGRLEMDELLLASPQLQLGTLARPVRAVVKDIDRREDVVAILQSDPVSVLPVTTDAGRFLGVIRPAELIAAIAHESSSDLQTMVGASADEGALSPAWFAVRKRLPWLQINLLTAFLAAAVVGLFEGTIARFTALAVLLPVVAGQSGNSGAQALAVTMRGLVLREVSIRQWPRIVAKEAAVGLVNGLAVALTTAIGVFVWSRSAGLVAIIVLAMVISMVAAGLAGALVPIMLRRLGQDPATASSIILTTVTDVVGFFSFLGIATLLAGTLAG
ncbi:MAG: magnesium transporter [Gammaproteobacteria bacterium]